MDIKINYHSSILINNEIYVDPLNIEEKGNAKFIFITHNHWDHFSPKDIRKIINKDTIIICPKTIESDVKKEFNNKLVLVEPAKNYEIKGLKFETFPSYNLNKQFHPKQNAWCGYILEIDGERVAVVGDSDNTKELRSIKTDILLIPIGGTYTMTAEEAAAATKEIKPRLVIPTHYGDVVGDKSMGKEFKELLIGLIDCKILID